MTALKTLLELSCRFLETSEESLGSLASGLVRKAEADSSSIFQRAPIRLSRGDVGVSGPAKNFKP